MRWFLIVDFWILNCCGFAAILNFWILNFYKAQGFLNIFLGALSIEQFEHLSNSSIEQFEQVSSYTNAACCLRGHSATGTGKASTQHRRNRHQPTHRRHVGRCLRPLHRWWRQGRLRLLLCRRQHQHRQPQERRLCCEGHQERQEPEHEDQREQVM